MIPRNENGLTLMELLITVAILVIIAAVATPLLSGSLNAHRSDIARSRLYQEGVLIMEQLTGGVRQTTYLFIPNAHAPTRNILALSGRVNEDGDYYFDPLFPRIDEDSESDLLKDKQSGIAGLDDDGDGSIDETPVSKNYDDDDEDGSFNEDKIDGIDNDNDGNVDEDPSDDHSADAMPGIIGMDDDGDASVDETGFLNNDDEDGNRDEDPPNALVYSYNAGTKTLSKIFPYPGTTTALSTRVTFFEAKYETPQRTLITLTLTGDDGQSVTFSEFVCPRNVLQKTGKRVK